MEQFAGGEGSKAWLAKIFKHDDIITIGIGDLSRATGVTTTKLRYWTDKGYINCLSESEGNRKYKYETVFKVRAMKAYLDEGYTLATAAQKMAQHRDVIQTLKHLVTDRIESVQLVDDGSHIIDFGSFDSEPTKHLIAQVDSSGTHFRLE
ncbi:MerR family transcriptional regulator [Furfurilactobacillus curtus]|uniref:MerR family transcriptional regulator n=1 Tax=Furfurilactobacillus curtus TaxID=1746200 RepID=A0ABQ5JQ47_9LACO